MLATELVSNAVTANCTDTDLEYEHLVNQLLQLCTTQDCVHENMSRITKLCDIVHSTDILSYAKEINKLNKNIGLEVNDIFNQLSQSWNVPVKNLKDRYRLSRKINACTRILFKSEEKLKLEELKHGNITSKDDKKMSGLGVIVFLQNSYIFNKYATEENAGNNENDSTVEYYMVINRTFRDDSKQYNYVIQNDRDLGLSHNVNDDKYNTYMKQKDLLNFMKMLFNNKYEFDNKYLICDPNANLLRQIF